MIGNLSILLLEVLDKFSDGKIDQHVFRNMLYKIRDTIRAIQRKQDEIIDDVLNDISNILKKVN